MKYKPGGDNSQYFAEAREYIKKKKHRIASQRARKLWAKRRPKGEFDKFVSYEESLVRYKQDIQDIITVAYRTCRSQTEQSHPMKPIALLSKQLVKWKRWERIELEDIEQVVQTFWWITYQMYRGSVRPYKMSSLRWYLVRGVCSHLPKELASWATSIVHSDTYTSDDTYYPESKYVIQDLADLFDDCRQPPLSLLTQKEKLILYMLERYPGQYTRVAKLLTLHPDSLKWIINGILGKLSEEYLDATTYTAGPRKRRANVTTQSD